MFLRIETIGEKKLLGKSCQMSLSNNKTSDLWYDFMSQRKEIKFFVSEYLYSVQVYDPSLDFKDFNPMTVFEKWAAVEVPDYNVIPKGFKPLVLKSGLYAVFLHKGKPSDFKTTPSYIFGEWLPNSDYDSDSRAHFELLGKNYKNNNPDSEEEVWIPIKKKDAL
jgi:AraC family transcriptional regulator